MIGRLTTAAVLVASLTGPALAEEPGSGLYAKDCDNPGSGYDITVDSDGTARVQHKGEVYENVLTSYSFFGNSTPSDFIVAIMFDAKNNPLPDYKGQTGWVELWEGDPDTYLLENGRASKEMKLCN